ncbi:MAG: mechanosensitive ion channel family protein [Cyanobacteria bacterium J06626_18]
MRFFPSLHHCRFQLLSPAFRPVRWRRYGLLFGIALLLVSLTTSSVVQASPLLMQIPGGSSGSSSSYTLGWVEMDGYQAFQIAAPGSAINQRRLHIGDNLQAIRDRYLQLETPLADISDRKSESGQPEVYVNGQYLMTVTPEDANLQGMTPSGVVQQLDQTIPQVLSRASRERQPAYRERQVRLIIGVVVLAIAAMVALNSVCVPLLKYSISSLGASLNGDQLNQDQRDRFQGIKKQTFPIICALILIAAILWALGRFPETRAVQEDWLAALKLPIAIIIVAVIGYIGMRLSHTLIEKLLAGMTDEDGFSGQYSRRARLRIATLSSVLNNVASFIWVVIGLVIALSVTNVNLGLVLASIGIIGLAFSLVARNLIKGAMQGFFIILEDQFEIGDVVQIDDDAGIVENLNLVITQIRDAGGRLISIPNSDITRVANFSLHWSRADLKLPIHYKADIDQMLDLARQVGAGLQGDPDWSDLILEEPQILGVDAFNDSSVTIRIWIKTKPMKQWDVSREYRRRFMQALRDTDTEIPFPQRDVWLHPSDEFVLQLKGSLEQTTPPENGNGRQASSAPKASANSAKNDAQPRNAPESQEDNEADVE